MSSAEQSSPLVRPWIQGSRDLPPGTKTSMEWQKLLFCRLTGLFSLYISSGTTLDSEALLRLPRSVYYGVGRNSPAFGKTIAMFDPVISSGAHGAITTPFDTGGLAQEHIHLRPGSPTPADVVDDANVPAETHQAALNEWISGAYPPGDYRLDRRRSRPRESPVAAIVLTDDTDDRGWTWEGRILAQDYAPMPLTVRRVYLKHGALEGYWDWFEDKPPLGPSEIPPHEEFVNAVSVEVDSPYVSMMEDLGKDER